MNFIAQKIIKIIGYGAVTLAGTVSSAFLYQFALEALSSDKFVLGALMATLVPVILFTFTFIYQKGVVVPVRQLSLLSKEEIKGHYGLVSSIASKRKITEKVPLFAASVTAFSSIAIIPSDILSSIDATATLMEFVISSLLIALLALVSFHAMKVAIASLKYNLQLQN